MRASSYPELTIEVTDHQLQLPDPSGPASSCTPRPKNDADTDSNDVSIEVVSAVGVARFLDVAAPRGSELCPGCPVAPTALEAPIISPRLRETAAKCFEQWEALLAARLRADDWLEDMVPEVASAVLALIEGALLLARVSGQVRHLDNAKRAVRALVSTRPSGTQVPRVV